jgi:hypothetical protein
MDYSLISLLLITCGSLPGGGKELLYSHMRPDRLSRSTSLHSNMHWGKEGSMCKAKAAGTWRWPLHLLLRLRSRINTPFKIFTCRLHCIGWLLSVVHGNLAAIKWSVSATSAQGSHVNSEPLKKKKIGGQQVRLWHIYVSELLWSMVWTAWDTARINLFDCPWNRRIIR